MANMSLLLRQSTCHVAASSQQARPIKASKSRSLKLPSVGTSVNFVDVLPQKNTSEVATVVAPCIREEHLTKRQRVAVTRLCDQLQVAPRVAVAITAQEPSLADYGIDELTTMMAMFAEYFGMSLVTLGKILTLRPDFVANPHLLQSHINQMSSLLSINAFDLPSLISSAPELIAYSPQYFASELHAVARLLQVEAYEAAALVRLEPRVLVVGIKKLTDRLERLSVALNKPYPAVAAVARTLPTVLFLDMQRLQKKRAFMEEVCSMHPSWQQQLAEMPVLVLMEILKSNGVPVFMRLRYLSDQGHQPSTDLVRVFAASTRQFEKQWPQWALWAEWNTPSYLFE